eukprot:CAMPEP_0194435046 /NCGR_PEP_ID=MMETSP0176-20130528/86395_1 /TAXON_ID=216777 /ORGANISM="Proboscia alata, Strain PI-D3" /LENGTH=47 /DNA_ID= /DNA_START= /DNA_END= /DNA_ORIENTATION=
MAKASKIPNALASTHGISVLSTGVNVLFLPLSPSGLFATVLYTSSHP